MSEPCVVLDAEGYPVTPDLVVAAYQDRCFPMAEERDGRLRWFRPPTRAVIDWQHYSVPRSLAKRWRQQPFELRWDTEIPAVIAACAEREETWISRDIEALYVNLGSAVLFMQCRCMTPMALWSAALRPGTEWYFRW